MLAVFDSIFITTASVTFSLPLLSNYWQVFIIYISISIDLNMAIMMMMMTIFRLGSTLISFLGYFRSFKSPSMAQFGQTYADDVEDGDMMIIVIIFVTNISMTIIYMTSMTQVYSVGHH